MKLTVLGHSPSFPNPGLSCSGYLISTDTTSILADCGHGVASSLRKVREPWDVDAVVISHMDPDHFFDLIPLHYTLRFLGPPGLIMPLWLPPGGLTLLRRLADAVGEGGRFLNGFETHEYDPSGVLDVGDVTMSFGPMKHFVEAWGMRLGWRGSNRKLVYTADTAYSPEVVRLLDGADLAIVEATLLEYRSPIDSEGHSTARIAAEMAREAGVKHLLLTHYEESLSRLLLADASKIFPERVELAIQGQEYEV